jgi:membrane protein DedA with SNARE-associated domain
MEPAQLFERVLQLPDGVLYALLFSAALLENLLPPFPGDATVVFGAYLAGVGRLSLALTFVLATMGSWCGFMVYYGLGRWLGRTRVHDLVGRWITPATLQRGEDWVRRYGHWVVLGNRMLAGARSVISLAAGFAGMRPALVGALALLSSLAWSALLVGAGYLIGEEWQRAVTLLGLYDRAVLALLALGALAWLLWRRRRRAGPRAT